MKLSNILKPGSIGVVYGRHSTEKQNMDTQIRRANELANKYNCTIKKEYLDPAVSSRKKNRKQLQMLLAAAQNKEFDFVIIYDHTRLARLPEDHDMLRFNMSIYEIPIVESSTETLYDSGDLIVSSIKDGIAKYQLDKIRSNTKEAMETLVDLGYWTGGRGPFGYKYHKKGENTHGTFENIEHEQILVKRIFELYQKNHGFQSIAKLLPAYSYRGKSWNKDRVKNVVTNPIYAGYISIRRKAPGRHNAIRDIKEWKLKKSPLIEPVISKIIWDLCWDLYKQKKEGNSNPKFYKTSFLLKDLIWCKECKSNLINKDQRARSKNGKVYGDRVYICESKDCKYKLVAEDIHTKVKEVFTKSFKLESEQVIENMRKEIKVKIENENANLNEFNEASKVLEEKLKLCNEKIKYHFNNADDNKDFIEVLEITKEHIEKQIKQINTSLYRCVDEIKILSNLVKDKELLLNGMDGIDELSEQSQFNLRRLFLDLVDVIIVDKKGNLNVKLKYNLGSMTS